MDWAIYTSDIEQRLSDTMDLAEIERELLEEAIHAFHDETGLLLDVVQEQVEIDGLQVDAIIKARHHSGKLAVEVKRWAQQANWGGSSRSS